MARNHRKTFLIGDPCRECGNTVTDKNCVFSGTHARPYCRKCWEVKAKMYNSRRNMIHHNMKQRYGITPEEYNQKLQLQLGGCAICKQPCNTGRNLAIDHNHTNNLIRDLLCQRCNVVLGLVNDDELLLLDMMDYLKRHQVEVAS